MRGLLFIQALLYFLCLNLLACLDCTELLLILRVLLHILTDLVIFKILLVQVLVDTLGKVCGLKRLKGLDVMLGG